MWQEKLKEIIYILENSNVNEIEVNFWGRKYRVSKSGSLTATSVATPVQTSEPLLAQSAHRIVAVLCIDHRVELQQED